MINKILTDVVRIWILKHDLYQTGNTFRFTKVLVIPYSSNTLTLYIESTPYFKYLWKILERDVLSDEKFNEELTNILINRIDLGSLRDLDDNKMDVGFYTSLHIRINSDIVFSSSI